MTRPRLEACYFDDGADEWTRFARVLDYTARQHCPDWDIHVERIGLHRIQANAPMSFKHNTAKLEHWGTVVEAAPDGDQIALMDVDTMIVRPIDDIGACDFNLAYTTRRNWRPFNAGVMFLRVCDPVRAFMAEWVQENRRLLRQNPMKRTTHIWREQYGGVNQAAFAHTLESLGHTLRIAELPCDEWNCEDTSWSRFDPEFTRIVHVKGALRIACLSREPFEACFAPIVERWRGADHDARRSARVA